MILNNSRLAKLALLCAAFVAGAPIYSLDQTDIKLVTGDQDNSIALDMKCKPVGLAVKIVPVITGFFNVTAVNEAAYRKKAVELNANTVQTLFEFTSIRGGSSWVAYAYVRFWQCPQ